VSGDCFFLQRIEIEKLQSHPLITDKIRGHFSDRDNLDDLKYYHLIDRKTIHNLKTKLSDPTVIQDSNGVNIYSAQKIKNEYEI
jgi:hypothetical protein